MRRPSRALVGALRVGALLAVAVPAGAVHAQPTAPADTALVRLAAETARRTARYADRRAAVADGYRRIGADFPGMGEHWLHPGALAADTLDPGRPALLAYATLAGRPTLLGAGFLVVTRGAAAPAVPGAPGWPAAWWS